MEEMEPKKIDTREQEIVFSKSIKAGKRIYYIDVKRNRKNDLFVAITESKKIISGFDDDIKVSYEKHKIFLYKEDFDKFSESLEEVIDFIKMNADSEVVPNADTETENETKVEVDKEEEATVEENITDETTPPEFNMDEFEEK